jgi:hypothetical protein
MRAMRTRAASLGSTTFACLLLAVTGAWAVSEPPVAVSPGDASGIRQVEVKCPTFSWGAVPGSRAYEVVVYQLDGEGLVNAQPILRTTIPGTALSWTPSLDEGLTPGGTYAWSVRAVGRKVATDWSQPSLFQVASGTTEAEFREALATVERYLAETRGFLAPSSLPTPKTSVEGRGESPAGGFLAGLRKGDREVLTASDKTAIEAEVPDTSGVITYGVFGKTNSSDDTSAGVLGVATAESGDVFGVWGRTFSTIGVGVQGNSEATTGGVGVVGVAASSGLSVGTAGVALSPEGYGGLFWNFGGGDALAVVDPENLPTSVDEKFVVDLEGNVGLQGVVEFAPTDTPPTCDSSLVGAVYFDASENWLCLCDGSSWKRADDPTDDCST